MKKQILKVISRLSLSAISALVNIASPVAAKVPFERTARGRVLPTVACVVKSAYGREAAKYLAVSAPVQAATQAAQDNRTQSHEINIVITQNVVRFTSQGESLEWRLEVFNQRTEVVFDSGLANGASLEWPLRDQQGQAIESGLYAYTLTTKAATDEAARSKRGHLIVDRASNSDRVWVTSSQEAGLGAGSEATKLTIVSDAETTVGGVELPATAPPRASLGERSALPQPAPVEAVKDEKEDRTQNRDHTTAQSLEQPAVYGQGTTNRITKWRHGSYGLLMDSAVSEVGGNVGIGTDTPNQKLVVNGGSSAVRIAVNSNTSGLNAGLSLQHNSASKWSVAALGTDGDFQIYEDDGGGNRLYIKGDGAYRGNVGIGTINPGNGKLHVEGGSQVGIYSSSNFFGVYGYSPNVVDGAGVFGLGRNAGVRGDSEFAGGVGVAGNGFIGLRGVSATTPGFGVYGQSASVGVFGTGGVGGAGVIGEGGAIGVRGSSSNGWGLAGISDSGTGVVGQSLFGFAGDFRGNVRITGSLSKGGGSFNADFHGTKLCNISG